METVIRGYESFLNDEYARFLGCDSKERTLTIEFGVAFKGDVVRTGEIIVSETGKSFAKCTIPETYTEMGPYLTGIFDEGQDTSFESLKKGFFDRSYSTERYAKTDKVIRENKIPNERLDLQVSRRKARA